MLEISLPCESSDLDFLVCLVEYLRRPDARLKLEGEHWSATLAKNDNLNLMLADIIERALPKCDCLPWPGACPYCGEASEHPSNEHGRLQSQEGK